MNELIVDNFAGGGGASQGIETALGRSVDFAINHDPEAIAMHRMNHPGTRHLTSSVWDVNPGHLCAGRQVGLGWFSPDCFPAGTLVLTERGYRSIEEIEAGDAVLTHKGLYRPVTAVMTSVRPLVTVRGHGHPGISVSPEHPFYTRSACNVWNNAERHYDRKLGEPAWTKASDLRTVGAPMNAVGGDLSFWATPCRFPMLPVPPVGGRGMELSPMLMWLAGRYVGDGWTRLTETRADLVITCSKLEADGLRPMLDQWRRLGMRSDANELAWHERETETAYQFTTNHRGLVQWLRSEFGHGATSKGVPAWALGMEEERRKSLLAGYLSADGHTREISGGDVAHCTTVSKTLAFGLRALAESLGFSAGINGPYENRTEIEGRQVNAAPVWIIKWRVTAQRSQTVRDGLHNWTRVRSVEAEERVVTVYNLSVDKDESYVAEGIVVHNCTFHSKARGAKPFRDRNLARRRRGLAWLIPYWAKSVRPRVIMLENVEEFADWGPLLPDGKPDPARRGLTFRRWHRQIENLGYQVDMRELRADRYGAPTTRKRLFVIARCDGQEIVFPEATHGHERGLQPFRTAAQCIDWSIPCPSIFERDRPLADATLRRIARGIMRYVVNNPQPFVVTMRGTGASQIAASAHELHEPLGVVSAGGVHHALITPFLTEHANASRQRVFRADEPLRTQCAQVKGGHFALVAPIIAGCGGRMGQSPERPVTHPMQTLTSKADSVVVSAFLAKHYGGVTGQVLNRQIGTVTTVDHHSLVTAFLLKYYGTDQNPRLREPIDTITTKDRFGLVMVHGEPHQIVDIGMRMLQPRELYRAQSFPDTYVIDEGRDEAGALVTFTKTAQVRMCGNSVAPAVAEALVRANVIEQSIEAAA